MLRYLVSLRLFLLTALLMTGVASALPAFADISVSAVTASPNLFPSAGGAVVVFVTCANAVGTPTGSATLTDSTGTVLSQNACFFDTFDANGNSVLFTYLIVQANNSTTAAASYTVNATVTGPIRRVQYAFPKFSAGFRQSHHDQYSHSHAEPAVVYSDLCAGYNQCYRQRPESKRFL